MIQPKHLLVDLDGTLLGAWDLPLQIRFIRKSLRRLSKKSSPLRAYRTLKAIKRELEDPSNDCTNQQRVLEVAGKILDVSPVQAELILDELMMGVFPTLKRFFFPIRGAREFLDWAKGQFPLTLATNPVWKPEIIRMRVEWAGIDPAIFETITDATMMRACKPSARYYRDLLELKGLTPEQTLLIGNEFKMDLPATRVGIPVFIVAKRPTLKEVTQEGALAPAWTGNYTHLRQLLEDQIASK